MERSRITRGRSVGWQPAIVLALTLAMPQMARGAATTSREPAFGLPHIFADTDLELARENGREIAKDRLGQLILLARVGRGTLFQPFGILDPSTINGDIEARRTGYTSSELNNMWAKLPQRERDMVMEYCKGVNDTIDAIYAGALPEPIEVNILRGFPFFLGADLFGNFSNLSDQVDPNYALPGGEWPNAGFQFTPELAVSIGILEVRNFGFESFEEDARFAELQALIGVHGSGAGTQIWSDLNFLNDPLAPISVPDATTPGFGGPLAALAVPQLVATAQRYPHYDYLAQVEKHHAAAEARKQMAMRLGAWPALGSYAWLISGAKSASGYPWLGGFPQTGIQTPSIMHFVENRSAEGPNHRINGIGMEFAGAPLVLIGHTDSVAYTTTTAGLRLVDTFFEQVVGEDSDVLHYNDEGTPAALKQRTETFINATGPNQTRVFFRSHERNGNNGSRPVTHFMGDRQGTVDSATGTTLVDSGAFDAGFIGGYVAIVDGPGAGQIRAVAAVPDADTLQIGTAWTTPPTSGSTYVAVKNGNTLIAVAVDSLLWQEESTTVLGFAQFQRAANVLDMRKAVRIIPSTHNFFAADNQAFNGVGTESGNGNIGYWSSGFSRYRLGGQDSRLPLDGTLPNPLVFASGTVGSATANSVTISSGSLGNLSPIAINYRYQNPTQQGVEYVVAITTGTGAKQSRRIASNTATTITVEADWGVTPVSGDSFEVYKIVGMPEAINPAEGFTANWNNKAATADEGNNFGRQFRHIFILERLASENAWDRTKERQLNKDVAGLDGKGDIGRYLLPRLRTAVNGVGNGGNPDVDTVLAALEANQAGPEFGRNFIDPISATTNAGEVAFMNSLVNKLAQDIYGDEYAGAVGVPTGSRALNIVQHAIDSAAGGPTGRYTQAYSGDYFNGTDWRVAVRDSLSSIATTPGIPADSARGQSTYNHPLSGVPALSSLMFPPTPFGNRGTYEQIIDVSPTLIGEFMFPLGQSGLIQGSLAGVTSVDPNFTSLHPIWRDWRFVPLLHVAQDMGPMPDHFLCYKAKSTPQTPKFEKLTVTLDDQFESGSFEVKKPKALCAPANKNGEGVRDQSTHLESYLIKGAAAHVPQIGVQIEDQFGTLSVDTIKPVRLLVPSTKGLGAPPTEPLADNVDHFKCYKIRVTPGTTKFAKGVQATVVDQFENRVYDIKKPFRLCTPVGKNGAPIINPSGHLMCYKAQRASGQPDHTPVEGQIHISNQFGSDQRLDTVKEETLCVPAVKNGVAASADVDGDGVFDGYERWYYGDTSQDATSDTDGDGATLLQEFNAGSDPTNPDTDGDGTPDGSDSAPQDRLTS